MSNSLLQKAVQGFGNSASARTLAYGSNVSAGSLLAVWVVFEDGSGTTLNTITVSDNINGSWAQAGTYADEFSDTVGRRGAWFYFKNSGAGAITVTVTPSASVYMCISIHEYSVPSPTAVSVDGTSRGNFNGTASSISTGSCPVSGAGELVLAGWGQGNATGETVTVAGSFTIQTSQTNGATEGGGTADDQNASAAEAAVFSTTVGFNEPVAMAVSFITSSGATSRLLLSRRRKVALVP